MVPGSTLMYGSSLRTETEMPRALSRRPMLAAVMPFPREEVTPPVTKTYFAMGRAPPGFFRCYRIRGRRASSACLLYTSDAADDLLCVDLGGRRIIKKKKNRQKKYKPSINS